MRIGNIEITGQLTLAPMAGVSDFAFRKICREQGASLTTTEMVSAKALVYGDKKTKQLCYIPEEEHPSCIQIFGHEPEIMADAAVIALEESKADILDINMGCPVNKIIKSGDGSALMRDMDLASKIISSVNSAVDVPVTVKFRKGFDKGNINAVEFGKMCEESGASAIAVHGRTRAQMYNGHSDWDIIRDVKNVVGIPVIANGDVLEPKEAEHILKYTGCDAAMIGRGAFGNPWIFSQGIAIINGEEPDELPPVSERLKMGLKQIKLLAEIEGERLACLKARHHMPWYLYGVPYSAKYRQQFTRVETIEDIECVIHEANKELR